jgi:hypothetical protein
MKPMRSPRVCYTQLHRWPWTTRTMRTRRRGASCFAKPQTNVSNPVSIYFLDNISRQVGARVFEEMKSPLMALALYKRAPSKNAGAASVATRLLCNIKHVNIELATHVYLSMRDIFSVQVVAGSERLAQAVLDTSKHQDVFI